MWKSIRFLLEKGPKIAKGRLQDHPSISKQQYYTDGGTPLFDVLGETLDNIHDNSTIILATDGEDTTSWRFSRRDISKKIEKAYKERDIQFIYLHKGPEAFSAGQSLNFIGVDGKAGSASTFVAAPIGSNPLGSVFTTVATSASAPMFRHLTSSDLPNIKDEI